MTETVSLPLRAALAPLVADTTFRAPPFSQNVRLLLRFAVNFAYPFRWCDHGRQGGQNHGVQRRGVTNIKVLEDPFKLEQVGRSFYAHSWLQKYNFAHGGI